jgi:hypothetical protein
VKKISIYPANWAEMNKEHVGQKYRPSNGAEGEIFLDAWCSGCARDLAMSQGMPIEECDDNQKCDILGRSFLSIDDPAYPTEWQYGADGQPRCTAFVPVGQPIPIKDEHTLDMFAASTENGQRGSGE